MEMVSPALANLTRERNGANPAPRDRRPPGLVEDFDRLYRLGACSPEVFRNIDFQPYRLGGCSPEVSRNIDFQQRSCDSRKPRAPALGRKQNRRPALKARMNSDQFSSVTGALRRAICLGPARTLNTHLQCVSSLGDVSLGLG